MKLNKDQLQSIENYLNSKQLIQIDLRLEVLDHMIVSIEKVMDGGIDFSEAIDLECKKWNPELEPYSSAWLGLVFSGPKLMMQKCVRLVKRLYLKTLVLTLLISGVLYGLTEFFNLSPKNLGVNNIVGWALVLLSATLFYSYYSISKNNNKSTYGYFIKINILGLILNLFIFNPLINNTFEFRTLDSFSFSQIAVYSFFFTYAVLSLNIYRKHLEINNYKLAV